MNRKARRIARRTAATIVKYTREVWNPAQEAAWAAGYGSTEAHGFESANALRGAMCLGRVQRLAAEGVDDRGALRRALRAVEVKG